MDCSKQNGGQLKEFLSVSKDVIKTSGNIANDLAKSMSNIIGGLTNGLEMVTKTAPDILGGLTVSMGSKMFDSSIKSKIKRLGLSMKGNA